MMSSKLNRKAVGASGLSVVAMLLTLWLWQSPEGLNYSGLVVVTNLVLGSVVVALVLATLALKSWKPDERGKILAYMPFIVAAFYVYALFVHQA